MISNNEYVAIAAHVYNDQRGGGAIINGTNKLDVPIGWVQISTSTGFAAGDNINALNPFSFTGGAYLNEATGEIVVAYKGTDFLAEFSGRAWNTVADLTADLGLAFAGRLALGIGQQLNASACYLAVKDWAVQNGHDPAKISFTGHSLGGGLAANMAVWYDRPATTFAAAPFEANTTNPIAIGAAIGGNGDDVLRAGGGADHLEGVDRCLSHATRRYRKRSTPICRMAACTKGAGAAWPV